MNEMKSTRAPFWMRKKGGDEEFSDPSSMEICMVYNCRHCEGKRQESFFYKQKHEEVDSKQMESEYNRVSAVSIGNANLTSPRQFQQICAVRFQPF
jgi:hypothetical protein